MACKALNEVYRRLRSKSNFKPARHGCNSELGISRNPIIDGDRYVLFTTNYSFLFKIQIGKQISSLNYFNVLLDMHRSSKDILKLIKRGEINFPALIKTVFAAVRKFLPSCIKTRHE